MRTINTYFLIDFENVNSAGLLGCERLTESDHIIIFFTKYAMKINMSDIANHGGARLDMIEVPAGRQSADNHIGSYMGYLIGLNKGNDCNIVVISKDTGFDNLITFWESLTNIKAFRAHQVIEYILNPSKTNQAINSTPQVDADDKKTELEEIIAEIAEKIEKTEKAEKIDKVEKVEKTISEKNSVNSGANKTALNNKVIQILSKAKYDNQIVKWVASNVVKNSTVKNSKQQIYRAIISKYGQSQGLNIYNCIKKSI